jgi:hypothetical protein
MAAAIVWLVVGVALLPVAITQAATWASVLTFDRHSPFLLLPFAPIACAVESGFHLRRFFSDRKVWDSLDPLPLRPFAWWLMPYPRPFGRPR